MATPHEKLAVSLAVLRDLQRNGRRVFQAHFRIGKCCPGARDGDSTPWYASFWEFCARYCNERSGEDWRLSPEQSLMLHAEKTVIPTQVIHSPKATNHKIPLLFGTSLYDLKSRRCRVRRSGGAGRSAPVHDRCRVDSRARGVARCQCHRGPCRACQPVRCSELLRRLIDGGTPWWLGSLAGALRGLGRAMLQTKSSPP